MAATQSPSFGDLLRHYRRAAGLTQEGLAERAGISTRSVSDLERGIALAPHRDTLQLLVAALVLSREDGAALEASITRRRGPAPLPSAADSDADIASPLPAPLTSFVGRDVDLAHIAHELGRPEVRLLTLTGPAGVGKTRLSLQAAAEVRPLFSDGVIVVSLANVGAPELVPSALAGALRVKEVSGRPLLASVATALREKQALLLLDNFEHLVTAAPVVTELLMACPLVKASVTSRAALRVRGEHEMPVVPLALPKRADTMPIDDLARVPAVRLFLDRVQAVKPDFALTPANAATVVEICRRVDGLPLAIELVAPYLKLLSPALVLTRLGRRLLRLTRSGPRDLPERQQTLWRTISWSYDLLDPAEQDLFRRLAVFQGGWTLDAAEAIGAEGDEGDEGDEHGLSREMILPVLAELVDKSLVRSGGREATGDSRFSMLETLRAYGMERLEERSESAEAHRRHAVYYLALAEEAEEGLKGSRQADWLARLNEEHDNLRAALRWSLDTGDRTIGLSLGGALWRFWYVRGYLSEGRQWLRQLLTATRDDGSPEATSARARALNGAGNLAYIQDDHALAIALYEESLALQRNLGDKRGIATSLSNLGNVAIDQTNYERATALHEESLALRRELGDQLGMAVSLNNLGVVARGQGRYDEAARLYEESLALRRQMGDVWGIAGTLINLATVLAHQGAYDRATAMYEEAISLKETLGDKQGLALALSNLADMSRERGDGERAVALYRRSLILNQEIGDLLHVAECLEGLACVAMMRDDAQRAARLFGAAAALRSAIDSPVPPADRAALEDDLDATRAALGHAGFAAAWTEGQALSPEQAITLASSMEDGSVQHHRLGGTGEGGAGGV